MDRRILNLEENVFYTRQELLDELLDELYEHLDRVSGDLDQVSFIATRMREVAAQGSKNCN